MIARRERLLAARSRMAEARDARMLAADVAMGVMHDPEAEPGDITASIDAWRLAADRAEVAAADVHLQRAAAGQLRVVAS